MSATTRSIRFSISLVLAGLTAFTLALAQPTDDRKGREDGRGRFEDSNGTRDLSGSPGRRDASGETRPATGYPRSGPWANFAVADGNSVRIVGPMSHEPPPAPQLQSAVGYVWKVFQEGGPEAALGAARAMNMAVYDHRGHVVVQSLPGSEDEVELHLLTLGSELLPKSTRGTTIHALVPLSALGDLGSNEGVVAVRLPLRARPLAVSEGVPKLGASAFQGFTPPPGLGLGRRVKVAVIDGGFQGWMPLRGTDLPPASRITAEFNCTATCPPANMPNFDCMDGCAPNAVSRHGTAVAEVIHDVAPDTEMLLISIDGGTDRWREALLRAQAWGADVINTSLGIDIGDNRNGAGPLCATSDALRGSGLIYATASGNEADSHEGFAWNRDANGFQIFDTANDALANANEFVIQPGDAVNISINWNSWPGPPTDDFNADLWCIDPNPPNQPMLVSQSTNQQCGMAGSTPTETLSVMNGTANAVACFYRIQEVNPANCPHPADVRFDVWHKAADGTDFSNLPTEAKTAVSSLNHPSDCASAIGVGAVCVHSGQLQGYSSQGPTLDGRRKPDYCSFDANSGVTYGNSGNCTSGFTGTSSATPHFTGALALLYDKVGGSFSLEQCLNILNARIQAVPGGDADRNRCGTGVLCLSEGGCP